METRKDPACTLSLILGWVARLSCSWLNLGKATPNFPWEKFPLGQHSIQNTNTLATASLLIIIITIIIIILIISIIIIIIMMMCSFMCYFSSSEHIAHYKKSKTTVVPA